MNDARPSAPPRTDPLAAALAFAIREAMRLETERSPLPSPPGRATVSGMEPKPGSRAA
jgi:hypothetical protein